MPRTESSAFVVDTSRSPFARLRPIAIDAVTFTDAFWQPRREINRTVTLPSQFRHIVETGRLENFSRAAGKITDKPFQGDFCFNDSDIYKWLEAAGSALASDDDPGVTEMIGTATTELRDAQRPDGYLNTYFAVERADQRWTNLRDMHEMYCAGHLFQGAVAHFRATGDPALIEISTKMADHIDATFGPGDGKREGACGHEEVEMALVELFRATGERRYLDLAAYFIDARGKTPTVITGGRWNDRRYLQDHVPFRELAEVTGHAVRMMYLACGATDVYLETGDETLKTALDRQWRNMTERRSYVNGALGARHDLESFGGDYELPNERAYAETCAAIGSVMWNHRLLLATGDAKYADLIEHTLFNAVLPGVSLDGQTYFYENPLEDSGAHRRSPWFGCACCPPNVARLLAQLPGYAATTDDANGIHVHLYVDGTITLPQATLSVRTRYPWEGDIEITVDAALGDPFALHLRVPDWCEPDAATVTVNGEAMASPTIERVWRTGDVVHLHLPMPVRCVESHPYVTENVGRIACFRGPILFCAEGVDHPGVDLCDLVVSSSAPLTPNFEPDLLGGVVTLSGEALVQTPAPDNRLYRAPNHASTTPIPTPLKLVPYYAWANRDPGQMRVWLRANT